MSSEIAKAQYAEVVAADAYSVVEDRLTTGAWPSIPILITAKEQDEWLASLDTNGELAAARGAWHDAARALDALLATTVEGEDQ